MKDNLGNADRGINKIEIGGHFSLALVRRCDSNNFSRFCVFYQSLYPLQVYLLQGKSHTAHCTFRTISNWSRNIWYTWYDETKQGRI